VNLALYSLLVFNHLVRFLILYLSKTDIFYVVLAEFKILYLSKSIFIYIVLAEFKTLYLSKTISFILFWPNAILLHGVNTWNNNG
jgi:hypothetical protein